MSLLENVLVRFIGQTNFLPIYIQIDFENSFECWRLVRGSCLVSGCERISLDLQFVDGRTPSVEKVHVCKEGGQRHLNLIDICFLFCPYLSTSLSHEIFAT